MIDKFCVYPTLGNLPTSFSVSLTFEEQLLLFNKKLNEIIDVVNEFSLDVIQNMINDAIQNLQNYVDNENEKLYNYIDNNIETVKSYTDTKVTDSQNYLLSLINQKVNYLITYINNNDEILRSEMNLKFQELEEKINNISFDDIKIIDPTTGILNNIQNVIDNIYESLRYYGLTANDYDSLSLTATEYDSMNITALDYDLYGLQIFKKNSDDYMYNPFTGSYEKLSSVINYLANLHKESPITASEYDALELSADNFDEKQLSAYEFDFKALSLLSV